MIVLAHVPRARVSMLSAELSASINSLLNQGIDSWEAHIVVCAQHEAALRGAIGKSPHIKWHVVNHTSGYRIDIGKLFRKIRTEWLGWMYAGDVVRADFLYWVLKPILTSDQKIELVTYGEKSDQDAQDKQNNSYVDDLAPSRLASDLHWESGYLDASFIVRKDFALNRLSRYPMKSIATLNIVRTFANRMVMPLVNRRRALVSHVRQILLERKDASHIRRRLQDSAQSKIELMQDLGRLLKTIDPGVRISISNEQKAWLQIEWPLGHQTPPTYILIPTRDRLDVLKPCIRSLFHHTDYPNYQVIVIDNGSVEPETRRYLKDLPKHAAKNNIVLSVLRDDSAFNFSALNNKAVRYIRHGVFVFLNNDIEIVDAHWLKKMVSHAIRSDVGCVGAKLLYPDGTIQHLGVTLGATHIASHLYSTEDPKNWSLNNPLLTCTSNPIAVTAAAMVIRAELFHQLGGFNDDQLPVAYNDVDLCLRVEEMGYRTVCIPRATLIHHESMSRKLTKLSQLKRERQESRWMRKRWSSQLALYPGNQSL